MSKIILLGTAHPLRGGLASYNERLAGELIAKGHDVSIYTFRLQYPSVLFPGKTQFSTSPPPKEIDIKVVVNSINPWNWLKIGKEIAQSKPDILITKYWLPFMAPCLGTICRLVRKNKHTKVICILDNLIPHEKRIGDESLTRYFMRSIDACIAQSSSVFQEINVFSKELPRKLNPHPIFDNFGDEVSREDALAHLQLDSSYKYVLFFGFIRDYKGLDIILKAFALLKSSDTSVKLIVAGEFYSDPQPYLDIIRSLDLSNHVILKTDFIPDEEVRYYFCAANIVAQPYKHATQSGVTQICYHFNRPMLVTNVGGLPEIVPNGKVGYVTEANEHAVADALSDFFLKQRESEFSNNVKTEKIKYAWSTMVDSIIELSEQVKR